MWKGAVVLIYVLAVYVCAAELAIGMEPKPEKFKNEEGCYMAEFDKVLPFGSSTPSIKRCVEYRCGQQGVVIAGCGVVNATPPLRVVEDKSKPFPNCCPRIVGPESQ